MIKRLLHNRSKSASLICKDCYNKEYRLFINKSNVIKQAIKNNQQSSFFELQDQIEQDNRKKIMKTVFARDQLSNRVAFLLTTNPNAKGNTKYNNNSNSNKPLTYDSLITSDTITQRKENEMRRRQYEKEQRIITHNQELFKQKTKIVVEQSYKHSIWKTQMFDVANTNREMIKSKSYKAMLDQPIELNKEKKVITDIEAAIEANKRRTKNRKRGLNEEIKGKVKEEIEVTCSHGRIMGKCSLCNRLVPKRYLKLNLFAQTNR